MMIFLICLVIAAAGFVSYVHWVEKRTVFLPQRGAGQSNPNDIGLAYENVFIMTLDGVRLHGWFVPAEKDPSQAVTFLFFHGNAGNINGRVEKVGILHEFGGNVLIIDYRGYGLSEGAPSEEGIYLDASAAFDYAIARPDVDPDRIIVYGVSLGGAPAADVMLTRPAAAGLILHSTFTSAKDMAKEILPVAPSFLIRTQMDTFNKIQKIRVPKLFIHARQDDVIPYCMSERLFELAAEPKEFLSLEGGHTDGHIVSRDRYVSGVEKFLKRWADR